MATATTTIRRVPKWAPPPPQTPRILHLPRRTTSRHRKTRQSSNTNNPLSRRQNPPKGKLETLFDQERSFSYLGADTNIDIPPVVLLNSGGRDRVDVEGGDVEVCAEVEEREEEKWRFQAEMLRAECNLLRMEREVAEKKMESERGFLQRSLKSAVNTLLSGKKKISEGENVKSLLEEEIEELSKKLMELQRSSRMKSSDLHSCSNFDKQTSLLQKQLEKYNEMKEEGCVQEIQEVSGGSLLTDSSGDGRIKKSARNRRSRRFTDVETLRRKMERMSKGKLLRRMEEVYGSMLSATTNSVPGSASTSRRYDLADLSSFSFRQSPQEAQSGEIRTCSGHCNTIVRRIMEQVKAETEQWSQMQEMLGKVKEEMEELQGSRDFWEEHALESDHKIQTLQSEVEEWKQKAVSSEIKENQLQKQVQEFQQELEKLRLEKLRLEKSRNSEVKTSSSPVPVSLGAQLAMEKRELTCRVKERNPKKENTAKKVVDNSGGKKSQHIIVSNKLVSLNRHPFKDIGNLSPVVRQNSNRYVYPLNSPKIS